MYKANNTFVLSCPFERSRKLQSVQPEGRWAFRFFYFEGGIQHVGNFYIR